MLSGNRPIQSSWSWLLACFQGAAVPCVVKAGVAMIKSNKNDGSNILIAFHCLVILYYIVIVLFSSGASSWWVVIFVTPGDYKLLETLLARFLIQALKSGIILSFKTVSFYFQFPVLSLWLLPLPVEKARKEGHATNIYSQEKQTPPLSLCIYIRTCRHPCKHPYMHAHTSVCASWPSPAHHLPT